jgi:hypothetical protein
MSFDTRQHNFIFWKTHKELHDKLQSRIRAIQLDPLWEGSALES